MNKWIWIINAWFVTCDPSPSAPSDRSGSRTRSALRQKACELEFRVQRRTSCEKLLRQKDSNSCTDTESRFHTPTSVTAPGRARSLDGVRLEGWRKREEKNPETISTLHKQLDSGHESGSREGFERKESDGWATNDPRVLDLRTAACVFTGGKSWEKSTAAVRKIASRGFGRVLLKKDAWRFVIRRQIIVEVSRTQSLKIKKWINK